MATYPRPPSIRIHYFASLLAALLSISTCKAVKKGEQLRALLPYPWPAFFRETKFINTPDNKNRESKRKNKLYIIYFVTLPATISNYSFKEPGSPPRDSSHEDSRVSRDYCPIIQVSLNRFVWQNWLQFRNGPFPVNSSWIRKPQRTFTTLDD